VDGTHSAWLGVGEAAFRINRLTTTASQTAQMASLAFDPSKVGFFLNVSNYQPDDQLIQFGTWVSQCMAAATSGASWALGHFDYCPGQYDPALNFAIDFTPAYEATVTAGLQNMLAGATATTRFIIDSSRNGRGPLDTTPFGAAPFDQPSNVLATLASGSWCNPPGAGAGARPTMATGVPLLDAYAWIKVPGQSDGTCDSAAGVRAWDYSVYNPWAVDSTAQSTWDPLWGQVDPTAGAWFPAQALQLAENANPPLVH
jgi:endoglucanase